MLTNPQIADALDEIGDLLEFTGANQFRVRAYRNGARVVRDLGQAVGTLLSDGPSALTKFEGIGKDLADKIATLAQTGDLPLRQELREQVPPSVLELLRIPGLGPKKAQVLYRELHVTNLDELRAACESQRVRALKGFGAKTEQTILAGMDQVGTAAPTRMLWAEADLFVDALLGYLRKVGSVTRLDAAGSYRRGRETVADLDLLAVSSQADQIMDALGAYDGVERVLARGDTKMSIVLTAGPQVDLRVVPEESFGAALVYFTGSKDHNIVLRGRAKDRGLKINEWGVFEGDEYIAGRTEEDVYATMGLAWIPPELREARQEFDWADTGSLPRLIMQEDLRGDLHMHTTRTDGQATLAEMAVAAAARGLEYIAITDHSKRVSMANGLTADRLRQQWEEIDQFNADSKSPILVLKGVEVDILERGGLDLDDDVLSEADWIVASVHYGQNQPREQITKRIVDALAHPSVSAIAHPTGRLINRRKAYEVDMDAVFDAAVKYHKFMELNAHPLRLDLDDVACAAAKARGIPIVISTDAHSVEDLNKIRYGLLQARRGGLTPDDVVNCRPWAEVKKLLKRAKRSA